jgi:hypothetical protein
VLTWVDYLLYGAVGAMAVSIVVAVVLLCVHV